MCFILSHSSYCLFNLFKFDIYSISYLFYFFFITFKLSFCPFFLLFCDLLFLMIYSYIILIHPVFLKFYQIIYIRYRSPFFINESRPISVSAKFLRVPMKHSTSFSPRYVSYSFIKKLIYLIYHQSSSVFLFPCTSPLI